MSETSTAEVCRLVVVGPASRVDLSVPVHVPLADLMPTLLRSLGTDLADRGLEHSGWVLQRLGEVPLDEDLTTSDLNLLDGDILHLRPRSEQIPPLDFDDLVDGIATGIRGRSGLWRPETTRIASLACLGFWLLVALWVPLLSGDAEDRSLIALEASAVLLAATAAAVRLIQDQAVSWFSASAAVAFAAEAGMIWGSGAGSGSAGRPVAGGFLDGTLLAIAVAVVVMFFAVQHSARGPVAVGIAVTGGCALIAGALYSATDLNWNQVATLLLLFAIAIRPTIPLLAFKLAGLSMPQLPIEPEDLQTDIDPEPAKHVLERTAVADLFMTMMHLACGLVSGGALIRLSLSAERLAIIAVVLGALAQLLALRPMTSAWHRLALGIPAALGLATAALTVAARVQPASRALVVVVLLVLATAAAVAAHTVPKRRLTPIWGRAGDWLQTLTVVVLLPVMLGILSLFSLIRREVG